jgi:hypothetical protein
VNDTQNETATARKLVIVLLRFSQQGRLTYT